MLMRTPPATALRRRLLPLHVAVALQGFMLWVPIEKLFLNEIGFDPAAIGAMPPRTPPSSPSSRSRPGSSRLGNYSSHALVRESLSLRAMCSGTPRRLQDLLLESRRERLGRRRLARSCCYRARLSVVRQSAVLFKLPVYLRPDDVVLRVQGSYWRRGLRQDRRRDDCRPRR